MYIFSGNKSNAGKKYTKKEKVESVYARNAVSFSDWYISNYDSLIRSLKNRRVFDEDAFSETYLKIYDNTLYSGINIENYKSYFIRSYYAILQNLKINESRYCELLPSCDIGDDERVCVREVESELTGLNNDILDYVYKKYNLREFELFRMYMHLKPAINYPQLSSITSIKTYRIQRIVAKIKKDIKRNERFVKRKNELI